MFLKKFFLLKPKGSQTIDRFVSAAGSEGSAQSVTQDVNSAAIRNFMLADIIKADKL